MMPTITTRPAIATNREVRRSTRRYPLAMMPTMPDTSRKMPIPATAIQTVIRAGLGRLSGPPVRSSFTLTR
jgi:hypothetical protein